MSCPLCGAEVEGLAGCQAVWHEIAMEAYTDPQRASVHDLAFDACMQHAEHYGRTAKSYAAHLTRLCCGIERGGDPGVMAAIRSWLDGEVPLERPAEVAERGRLTVTSLRDASDAAEHVRRAREWAACVWAAHAAQHTLARQWLASAVAARGRSAARRDRG